ncbi:MAG TPA: MBL fold metallo-hydrolase, partial [Candidatus Lustribacter sp.]|nr:MBL fold metallo-hydrolase [Candidatus Lustribacter sp.]
GFEDLRDLDAVVVTHQHADHLDLARLGDLVWANPGVAVYADPQSQQILAAAGIDTVVTRSGAQVLVGEVTLTGVGTEHAFNHEWMPTVANVGVVLRATGEPSIYHPGDAYDGEAGPVDVLAVPINAPWTAVRDSIAFVRRVAPGQVVPIHDALLSPQGRVLYLGHIGANGGGAAVTDLVGRGAVTVGG